MTDTVLSPLLATYTRATKGARVMVPPSVVPPGIGVSPVRLPTNVVPASTKRTVSESTPRRLGTLGIENRPSGPVTPDKPRPTTVTVAPTAGVAFVLTTSPITVVGSG